MTDRISRTRRYVRRIDLATAWIVFFLLLATYWLTVPPTVSYWDCPEYVAGAYLLETGHPPGNPTWMLAERIVTMFAPGPEHVALAVNLSSGIFTAFAGFFLCRIIFAATYFVTTRLRRPKPRRNRHANRAAYAAGAALCGSLIFGWGDSVWFSAVEAEVYAMSIFMTAVCVWLMVKWAAIPDRGKAWRYLILIAYLFGLSIGIHQLNLLCIPALAMIWGIKRRLRKPSSFILIFFLSLAAVGCVLVGMMPSTIALASQFELFAVNSLGWTPLSGVAVYVILLGASLILALVVTAKSNNRGLMALAIFPAIYLSGIFIFSRHFMVGAAIAILASLLMVRSENFSARRLNLSMWMLTMLLIGYASYALIPFRGHVTAPANAQFPDNPFSFASYQAREQYGAAPLLYGNTPFSRPMFVEERDPKTGKFCYKRYQWTNAHTEYSLNPVTGVYDSVGNIHLYMETPELNMWFPRITSKTPLDLKIYGNWLGMDTTTMTRVKITEAIDSAGNPVARADASGRRGDPHSYHPTYLQHAQWLASYQIGYMYMRYLLWNFSGRQNDIPAQGEVQNGNFITGIAPFDEAMLGPDELMPADAGRDNPGRNRYFMLPLILGIFGAVWLAGARRRGQQTDAITFVLFILSGIAIVVYLNQSPCEPRERDYSFLGSYFAFSVWVGFGALALARLFRSPLAYILPLGVAAWMLAENYDDHDRSDRTVAREVSANTLRSVEEQAVIFVDGDNFTFPLWYAVEVEGIRQDVRVINLSYLTMPKYAASMLREWRASRPLASLLKGDDIWKKRFGNVVFDPKRRDTVDAPALLRFIEANPDSILPWNAVRLPIPGGASECIPLRNLTRSGQGTTLEFRKLMILNFMTANALSPRPRPFYWLRGMPSGHHLGISGSNVHPWMFGITVDGRAPEHFDSLLISSLKVMTTPNPPGTNPYMDETPAHQVAHQRLALVRAAIILTGHGHIAEARKAILMADKPLGEHPLSYGAYLSDDSVFSVRKQMSMTMVMVADSMRSRGMDAAEATRLRKRAAELLLVDSLRIRQWNEYRKALPPRLRKAMAPPQ